MAKIKFSALVSDMRNKLNGSVLSKNRYGNYMRNKTTPVNPQTTFQQNARAVLSSLSQAWAGLTEVQRNGWKALALTLPFTDIFGDPKTLTGNSLYVGLNANLLKVGGTAIPNAPLKVAVAAVQITEVTATSAAGTMGSLTVTFGPGTIPAGFKAAVFATPAINPGVSFVKNQFRFLTSLAAADTSPANITAAWNLRFGAVAPGQKIFIRIGLVSLTSGQQGIPSEGIGFAS
jgi:hypothetical protein